MLWTPRDVNVGNFLYHWLRCHTEQTAGRPVYALRTPAMDPWLSTFPRAAPLIWARHEVPFRAQRIPGYWQRWGELFTKQDLAQFIHDVLLDSPLKQAIANVSHGADLVVNVRRGDYYSAPHLRQRYAFDIPDYIARALVASTAQTSIRHIHVVSDDIRWCREHLDSTLHTSAAEVTFAGGNTTPLEDLATLAASPRLILTNSTFSYWGGYISGVLHPDSQPSVVAPWFHARFGDHWAAEQLDPTWTVITESTNEWAIPHD